MFWSVISIVLHAKDDNFKPSMGEQTRHLCYAKQIWSIKGMVGAAVGGLMNPLIKGTFMKSVLNEVLIVFQIVLSEVLKHNIC